MWKNYIIRTFGNLSRLFVKSIVKLDNFQVCSISFSLNELNESARNNGRIGISRNQISRSETCRETCIFTVERDKCAVAADDDENVVSYEKLPVNRVSVSLIRKKTFHLFVVISTCRWIHAHYREKVREYRTKEEIIFNIIFILGRIVLIQRAFILPKALVDKMR